MFRRALPVLAATLLVACGGGDQPGAAPATDAAAPAVTTGDSTAAGSSAAGSSAAGSSAAGSSAAGSPNGTTGIPAALQLTAPLVGGGEIELGALAGRPVLLWFWAPW